MKREYTLLTLGILITILPWLALPASLREIVFTFLGAWVILISYKYWKNKRPVPNQNTGNNIPEPMQQNQTQVPEQQLDENLISHERRQDTKPRI